MKSIRYNKYHSTIPLFHYSTILETIENDIEAAKKKGTISWFWSKVNVVNMFSFSATPTFSCTICNQISTSHNEVQWQMFIEVDAILKWKSDLTELEIKSML